MASDFTARLQAAVEAGTVTADTARAILNWIGPDGRIAPPTERAAAVARDVLEAAGLEFRLANESNPAATPRGKRTEQAPKRRLQTPIGARQPLFRPPPEPLRGPGTADPPKTRPRIPSNPALPQAAAAAQQATPSKPSSKSAAARSRAWAAWAAKEPAAAARFLLSHPAAVLDLLAPDADEAHGEELHALYDDLHHVENLVAAADGRSAVIARLRTAIAAGERQLLDPGRTAPLDCRSRRRPAQRSGGRPRAPDR